MAKEINPQDTTRAQAYKLWLHAPNPMVTFFKTLEFRVWLKSAGKKILNLICFWIIVSAKPPNR